MDVAKNGRRLNRFRERARNEKSDLMKILQRATIVTAVVASVAVSIIERRRCQHTMDQRTRIALELHDGPLQEMAAVIILMELDRVDEARKALDNTLADVRRLAFQLLSQQQSFDRERS